MYTSYSLLYALTELRQQYATSLCERRPETSFWTASLRLLAMRKGLREHLKRAHPGPSCLWCLYQKHGQFHRWCRRHKYKYARVKSISPWLPTYGSYISCILWGEWHPHWSLQYNDTAPNFPTCGLLSWTFALTSFSSLLAPLLVISLHFWSSGYFVPLCTRWDCSTLRLVMNAS